MPRHIAGVDAQSRNRSIVPSSGALESKLKAEPLLLLWRRHIQTATDEALKPCRYGEPSDVAIMARDWIERVDPPDAKNREHTFDTACRMLGDDPVVERARLLRAIDKAWDEAWVRYGKKRREMRTRAVQTVMKAAPAMGYTYALLLVSEAEYEDTAGISRPDPPARAPRLERKRRAAR